jgi:hypothetical protein
MAKVRSQVPFSRLWAGLYFLSLVWRLRKIKNPVILSEIFMKIPQNTPPLMAGMNAERG